VIGGVLLLQGFGIGLALTPATTAAFAALRPDQINDASPQQQILSRIGGSIGTALLIVVLQQQLMAAGGPVHAQAHGFAVTFILLLGLTAVAMVAAIFLFAIERRTPTPEAVLLAEPVAATGEAMSL
jgi:hypothetical protein